MGSALSKPPSIRPPGRAGSLLLPRRLAPAPFQAALTLHRRSDWMGALASWLARPCMLSLSPFGSDHLVQGISARSQNSLAFGRKLADVGGHFAIGIDRNLDGLIRHGKPRAFPRDARRSRHGPHIGCGHTSGTLVASHCTNAAFTSTGCSCASQWPERIVSSVSWRQKARMGSAKREWVHSHT